MTQYRSDWGLIGHQWAVERLRLALAHDRLRHAYLIAGDPGVGKSTLALAFAQAINCLSEDARPCGKCRSCRLIQAGVYADVNIIQAEERTLKIEQVREMQHTVALRPVEARYRVIILENFHEASGQAQDALLKTLEEPPPFVVILLTVNRLESVLPTIRSRCQPIALRRLSLAAVRNELERRGVDAERAALLGQLSGGRLGWAVKAIQDDKLLKERTAALDALEALLGADRITRMRYAEQLATDKERIPELLSIWQSYWRDVLILISAAHIGITNRDRKPALEQLTAALHIEDTQRILGAVQRTATYLNQNVNTRLAVEALMLDLPRHKLLLAQPPTA